MKVWDYYLSKTKKNTMPTSVSAKSASRQTACSVTSAKTRSDHDNLSSVLHGHRHGSDSDVAYSHVHKVANTYLPRLLFMG